MDRKTSSPPPDRPKVYRIEIPCHTARLNELLGCWRKAARLKRRDRQTVALACLAARVPPAEGKRRVSLIVGLGPRQRCDPDCFHKSLLDALVRCGALRNDSSAWVELGPVEMARAPRPMMTVVLEDLD